VIVRGEKDRRDAIWIFTIALVLRLIVCAWAFSRFPPTADGAFYDVLAKRIASGAGYTWLWPDGTITNVAHYPVGYPALIGFAYAIFGSQASVAMIVNAIVGAFGTLASHRLLVRVTTSRLALFGALAVALHPALLFYTPALMTEGVTASLLLIATSFAAAARSSDSPWRWRICIAVVLAIATYMRPQCIVFAPFIGALSVRATQSWMRRIRASLLVSAIAIACVLPWTVRNCVRMDRCAFVSVNGGWNLLIGAQTNDGAWTELVAPPSCQEVWSEAAKDSCFEREARAQIANDPIAWIARVPKKLSATFDYFGAAPWYLHDSNPSALTDRGKLALGVIETIASRVTLIFALVLVARKLGKRRRARIVIAAIAIAFACSRIAWPSYAALALVLLLLGDDLLEDDSLVFSFAPIVIAATIAIHSIFFGAGRYGLVVVPFVTMLAFARSKSESVHVE
jgi:hypothetical protein